MTLPDRQLDARLDALPRTAPSPEVWPHIHRRIHARRLPALPAIAAAVVMVLVSGWLLTQDLPDQPDFSNPAARVMAAEGAVMRELTAGPDWLRTVDTDSDWRTAWESNRTAINDIEAALANHPGDRLLIDLLARAHLRQAQLLRRLPDAQRPAPSTRI